MIMLGRHGNTFDSSSETVWVGSATDLVLTKRGIQQAYNVLKYMEHTQFIPKRIYCGPLRRTADYSKIIANKFGLDVCIDMDLIEINYGLWEGLNNEQIIQKFGRDVLSQWERNMIWPNKNCGWGESFEEVEGRVKNFFNKIMYNDAATFVCTSNGILRVMHGLLQPDCANKNNKVNTGAICHLEKKCDAFQVTYWNYNLL